MSLPLTRSTRNSMRKDLVRLRMEMQRQQLHYHSRPLLHPLQQLGQMLSFGSGNRTLAASKTPLAIGGVLLLTFLADRLGTFGKLARFGLVLYPIVHSRMKPSPLPVVIESHR